MTWLTRLSGKSRSFIDQQRLIIMLACCFVLAISLGSSLVYDFISFSNESRSRLSALAGIIAADVSAALAFNDHQAIQKSLQSLKADPTVIQLFVVDDKETIAAHYVRGSAFIRPEDSSKRLRAIRQELTFSLFDLSPSVSSPVVQDNVALGAVLLEIDSSVFIKKLLVSGSLGTAILILSIIVTYLLASRLGKVVTDPVLSLAATMEEVTRTKNYHLRARVSGARELAQLTELFNEMLSEISRRDEELLVKQEHLNAAQYELMLNEEKYRELVENANSMILRLAPDGTILFFNEYAENVFGFTRDEVLGKSAIGTIVPKTDTSGSDLAAMVQNLIAHPERYLHNENENICKNGERIWVSWANRAVYDQDGNLIQILSVGQNITDKRLLEAQVIEQQKMEGIGMLAGGMAHDINNLLTPIFFSTEMTSEMLAEDHPARSALATIRDAATKIRNLVRQVLLFSRNQKGMLQPVDINLVVSEFAGMLRRTVRAGIALETRICPDSCGVMADRTHLEQIIMNLVVNAQDAINGSGRITITTGDIELDSEYCDSHQGAAPGRHALLTITDTGCGMDDATRRKMFEPFFTTKPKGKGTGLGLSTVYGIVRQHGGHLDVVTVAGIGTTFCIFLPMIELPEYTVVEPAPVVSEQEPAVTSTLLLVDDNEMLRNSLHKVLARRGIKTLAAASPDEALILFQEHRGEISLLLSDIIMPGMNGPELYQKLREEQPDLPVLFMSGYASDIGQYEEISQNPDIFLHKPFQISALMQKLAGMLPSVRLSEG